MADVSQVKLPNGDIYDIKDDSASTATNWVNGSQTGSVRTVGSAAEDSNYTIGTYAVAEGNSTKASGYAAHAEGQETTASGDYSHTEGSGTFAPVSYAHAEGYNTTASGNYSHAEGQSTTASNYNAHAEGQETTASGSTSHAEGMGTAASGYSSHAEGYYTLASGDYSHAEGHGTTVSGLDSHAEGAGTIANHLAQHVFGQYNVADPSTASANNRGNYVEIVGNGANNARSNARTLDWDGNEVLAGKLTIGVAGTNSMDVATVGQIPTVPSNIVNTITTTAGAHTAITSQKGNVSFNVPTTAAHVGIKFGYTTSGNNRAVLQDSNGNLYVTQKDDNTWRGIQNNLTSTSTTDSLSAYQGKILNESKLSLTGGNVTGPVSFGDSVSIDDLNAGQLVVSGSASFVNTINGNIATASAIKDSNNGNSITVCYSTGGITDPSYYCAWDGYKITYISKANLKSAINTNTTYSAGTGLSLSSTTFSVKLGYTTSGNNRAVQADSNGNLYVTQKDDNTTYSSKAAASGGTDVSLVTTGEKYTWNSKTSNTGTITSVKTTAGAHTAINTTSGAVSFNVPTTAAHVGIKFGYTTSGNNRAVLQDSSGNLYVTQKDDNSGGTVTKVTAGTGLSIGTTAGGNFTTTGTINHTNSVTAQTTQAVYPIKIDAQGHISAYGSAQTILSIGTGASNAAAGNHTHSYLPLSGGTLTGDLLFSDSGTTTRQIRGIAGANDYWRIAGGASASNAGWMEIATADDGNEPIYVRQYTGAYTTIKRTLTLLDADGNTSLPGRLTTVDPINQIITGSGTAATTSGSNYVPAKWTFNTGQNASNGDIVTIKIPVAGHDYGVFMSVNNGTNYYPVVNGNGTTRTTTHYPNATPIMLVFDSSGSADGMYPLAGGTARTTVTGGVWRVINFYNSTYYYESCYVTTAAGTAAKVGTLSNYALQKGHLQVAIYNANSYAGAITLNINGTGAKPIYINGSASSSSNYTLPKGMYLVYYDGTNYYFRTDGLIQGTTTGNLTSSSSLNAAKLTGTVPTSCLPVYNGSVS